MFVCVYYVKLPHITVWEMLLYVVSDRDASMSCNFLYVYIYFP